MDIKLSVMLLLVSTRLSFVAFLIETHGRRGRYPAL